MALTPQQRRRQRFNQLLFMQMSMAAYASTKASWTPLELFQNDIVGGWWDPSDFSTMFQDSAGTTPVTAVEQPVGLHLDKSKGLALGAELVTSYSGGGLFGNYNTMSLGGTTLTASLTPENGYSTNRFDVTPGKLYRVTLPAAIVPSGGTWNIATSYSTDGTTLAGAAVGVQSIGTTSYTFKAPAGAVKCEVTIERKTSSGGTDTAGPFTSISVREILGAHRYQDTSAARPTLSARYNLLTKTEDLTHSDWTVFSLTRDGLTTAPDGTSTAQLVTFTGSLGYIQNVPTGFPNSSAHSYKTGVWIKRISGNTGLHLRASTGSVTHMTAITITNEWAYYTATWTGDGVALFDGLRIQDRNGSGFGQIAIWHPDFRSANDSVGLPDYQRVNTSTDYDTSGFPMYLRYDGTDDFMQTAAVDFSGTDAVSVFAGVRKLSDAAQGALIELTASVAANNGGFLLAAPDGASATFAFDSKGTAQVDAVASSQTAPLTAVISGLADISSDSCLIRVNGTQADSDTGDQGTGNYSNAVLYFGARAGTSLFFNGREYQTIIRGAASTATEIAAAESYVNNRTKAY